MFKIHPEIPDSMSTEAKAFILRCFEPDPDSRATANDLLTHEFLTVTSRKKRSKNSSFTGVCVCVLYRHYSSYQAIISVGTFHEQGSN